MPLVMACLVFVHARITSHLVERPETSSHAMELILVLPEAVRKQPEAKSLHHRTHLPAYPTLRGVHCALKLSAHPGSGVSLVYANGSVKERGEFSHVWHFG